MSALFNPKTIKLQYLKLNTKILVEVKIRV